jgi:hypothetical protein
MHEGAPSGCYEPHGSDMTTWSGVQVIEGCRSQEVQVTGDASTGGGSTLVGAWVHGVAGAAEGYRAF